jgi:YkoY family integral membrane protein
MEILHSVLGPDINSALLIILNLFVIESLLSVDNAAVLAIMVMDLPEDQRRKALKYGIFGAYFFRGLCLVLATWLIKIWWLKPLGGLYLLWLAVHYFLKKEAPDGSEEVIDKKRNWLYRKTIGWMGPFWATVASVELMDLAFSLDNVFAAVALAGSIPEPQKLYVVMIGVFLGILAMRFVAQYFVKLLEKYPALEKAAFTVIGVLGAKLILSGMCHVLDRSPFCRYFEGEQANLVFSLFTLLIFFLPVLSSLFAKYFRKG